MLSRHFGLDRELKRCRLKLGSNANKLLACHLSRDQVGEVGQREPTRRQRCRKRLGDGASASEGFLSSATATREKVHGVRLNERDDVMQP